jgi:hypothetical protein
LPIILVEAAAGAGIPAALGSRQSVADPGFESVRMAGEVDQLKVNFDQF